MSEFSQNEPSKDISHIKDLIDKLGQEKFGGERGQLQCRYINGTLLTELVNNHRLPGLVYTVQPDLGELDLRFKRTNWGFHSVTILKLDEDSFVAFDQTNNQIDGDQNSGYYYTEGTLGEISSNLEIRFGSHWDLTFGDNEPEVNPEISVRKKLTDIEQKIKSGELTSVTLNDITPETLDTKTPLRGVENKNLVKPLGLKYLPHTMTSNPQRTPFAIEARKSFTMRYA